MAPRIEDYAFIGDMHGSALVSRCGSVDWLCTPRFDSDACLAAMLGGADHGSWAISPAASDPRVQGTIRAIERRLLRDGFVVRYEAEDAPDGLQGTDATFLPCSFSLVDAYVYSGRLREAEELFTRLLGVRNDVGLLSEEYDPRSGRLVGNFPQAFSHLALIRSASVLAGADRTQRGRS